MTAPRGDADTTVATLGNGARVVVLRLPQLQTASVSVFVRAGSAHESRRLNGISHVVEHMVFKGTRGRDAWRINLDAERLGAEVDAHTDKDHTAFHLRGRARHAVRFVRLLGDIITQPTFPADELERERQVLLHECTEVDDDPMATAYKLFDRACWGMQPAAQAVIGPRRNLERFVREDLVAWVRQHYCGANLVLGVAGPVDAAAIEEAARAAFGVLPAGVASALPAPAYAGGVRSRRIAGSPQTHLVLGFPVRSPDDADLATVAAALFGEGMSSPLMDQLRERRGLVYYAACAADLTQAAGQFVVEASTAPEHVDELLAETTRLLAAQAQAVASVDLLRARNQVIVRRLCDHERPSRRLEDAALDLFVHGRVRSLDERIAGIEALKAPAVRAFFARMLSGGASAALVGRVGAGVAARVREQVAALRR
jgi:predicted Zn-dependent peptidase